MDDTLMARIVARCDADALHADHVLRKAVRDLERAIESANAMKIVGAWAKCRRLWSEYSGEPLV